jgi:hypothetical protein
VAIQQKRHSPQGVNRKVVMGETQGCDGREKAQSNILSAFWQ